MSLRNNTKKKLRNVGIATLVVFGVGAMAIPATTSSFNATGTGNFKAQAAKLSLSLGDDHGSKGTFNLAFPNMEPGEVQHQTLYITNTGSIPAVAKLGQPITGANIKAPHAGVEGNPALDPSLLTVGVSGITSLQPVTSVSSIGLGELQPGETKKVVVDASLSKQAGNEWQEAKIAANATVTLEQR